MAEAFHFVMGLGAYMLVAAGLLMFLTFVVNAVALTFWPTWAVRQVWSLIDEERMLRHAAMMGMDLDPNEWIHRPTGIGALVFAFVLIYNFFGKHDAPYYVPGVWTCWVLMIGALTVVQGFAWTFRPRWLARRYPSLTASFTSSKAGRIVTRVTGVAVLLFGCLLSVLAFVD